ncbi:MAG: hypothetical protein ABR961_12185 [Thermoanaerobaculaceae bacterium]|jgi:hypothetical protein
MKSHRRGKRRWLAVAVLVLAAASLVTTAAVQESLRRASANGGRVSMWGSNGSGHTTIPTGLTIVVAIAAGGYLPGRSRLTRRPVVIKLLMGEVRS